MYIYLDFSKEIYNTYTIKTQCSLLIYSNKYDMYVLNAIRNSKYYK